MSSLFVNLPIICTNVVYELKEKQDIASTTGIVHQAQDVSQDPPNAQRNEEIVSRATLGKLLRDGAHMGLPVRTDTILN